MSIIESLKSEIMAISPDAYKDAMLMRFGFTNNGLTHSRKDVCKSYNLDPKKLMILENQIIKNVFKNM